MNKATKILIVAGLLVVVAVIIGLKQKNKQIVEESSVGTEKKALSETALSPAEDKAASEQNLPKLIDLGAGKCVPCKMMAPILEEIKDEYKGILDVEFIDVWENPDEAKKYNIKMIPTQIFYNSSGKELFRHEGFYSKEDILGKYEELGINLQK